MALQFALPIAQTFQLGFWDGLPNQTPGNWHLNLDEAISPLPPAVGNKGDEDTSYIAAEPPTGQLMVLQMAPLLEPLLPGVTVKWHVVHQRVDPIDNELITLQVFQGDPGTAGSRFVAQYSYFPSTVYADQFVQMSPAQAADISDWSDLWCRIQLFSGSATGEIRLTQVYIEAGDPAVPSGTLESQIVVAEVHDPVVVLQPAMILIEPLTVTATVKNPFLILGPLVITPDEVEVDVFVPDVAVSSILVLEPDPVDVEVGVGAVRVNRTIHPTSIVVAIELPPVIIEGTITPEVLVVEVFLPSLTVSNAFKPTSVPVEVSLPAVTVALLPLVRTPDPVLVEVFLPAITTDIFPLIITPDEVFIAVFLPEVDVDLAPVVLMPSAVIVEIDTPVVAVDFGLRIVKPDPVFIEICVEAMVKVVTIIDPPPIIIEILLPPIVVIIPFHVVPLRTPRRPGRRFRPTFTPSSIQPPSTFRARFRHDARGDYRVFGDAQYRFYFRDGSPPEEGDDAWATSATLPATVGDVPDGLDDGDFYFSAEYFNGVIRSGFLPLGANGETYLRLKTVGGAVQGAAPNGPTDWRLELRPGGIVAVLGFYYDKSAVRALSWVIEWTTDGTDPPAAAPEQTVVQAMPTSGVAVLDFEVPAQADGTIVKVRLRTQRTGSTIESERPEIKQATAEAGLAVPTVELRDRWTGRLPMGVRP